MMVKMLADMDTNKNNNKMITVSVKQLIICLASFLIKIGLRKNIALITAEILVEGDLRGYPFHGVERIFQIAEGVSQGTLSLTSQPKLIKSSLSMAIIDGQFGLGQPVAKKAMHLAIKKAHKSGVGVVGVINAGHIGVLSYYSEIASHNNCVGLVMSTSSPAVIIAGGRTKTFGTNPISYSFPTSADPVTADFSTSKVSRSTIIDYLNNNKKIPLGWAVDSSGRDTNEPLKALKGGMHTIDADIKGSLISMLVSILAGHLIGGVVNPEVTGTRYMNKHPNKGDFFMAFSIAHFTDDTYFIEKSDLLVQLITQQGANFRVPGSKSLGNRATKMNVGITISNELLMLFQKHQINIS